MEIGKLLRSKSCCLYYRFLISRTLQIHTVTTESDSNLNLVYSFSIWLIPGVYLFCMWCNHDLVYANQLGVVDGSSGSDKNYSEPEPKPKPIPRRDAPAKQSHSLPISASAPPIVKVPYLDLLLFLKIFRLFGYWEKLIEKNGTTLFHSSNHLILVWNMFWEFENIIFVLPKRWVGFQICSKPCFKNLYDLKRVCPWFGNLSKFFCSTNLSKCDSKFGSTR